ncbi:MULTISPECIES: hypothetical protein [Pectobacterium]|uniref:Uncharacterized protein n=1 Tax=Pectobacterium parmentieri TaxID=1905730 RepID=A0ABS0S6B0_PECPM|nr:hypothetical protein [Pectobacterium parmentieri]MBI0473306.1 hypothetical protein [Pectobacterium parmentieri]MBI0495923.1 hypothetical protein [Pectobacterium parmentieri]MBI0557339.1 hypothetical protein [Pectobacterium parmentieri]MBI0570472.1 hypothetical protein [Pectobacterium parmentieri]MBI0575139.1 hypothetical protein [Pectobacterium parmentieri]
MDFHVVGLIWLAVDTQVGSVAGLPPHVWHYREDSRNQLRIVKTPAGKHWFYCCDPFGKCCNQTYNDIRSYD